MICMMAGFIANIILDPLMIFGIGIFPEMGIAGAAYATGIGQCLTLILYLVIYKLSPIPVKFRADVMKPEPAIARRLYLIGIPAALNTALPSLLVSALNGILADFSEKYVLVLGVYYKLQTFIYLTANGIVQGIRPLVGYNYGAGDDSESADRPLYDEQGDGADWRDSTAQHQSRIYHICCFGHLLRCAGRTW